MTDRCQTADRIRAPFLFTTDEKLREIELALVREHMRNCPKCKQRMTLFTEAAKTAEMPPLPEMTDDIG